MNKKLLLIPLFLLVVGCSKGNSAEVGRAMDGMPPIERGCLYIAGAIVLHGFLAG